MIMAKRTRTPHRIRQIIEDTSRRVAIYLRRSTDGDHQPFSPEAQETKLRAFVASQPGDWQIVAVYSDDASGATTDRPELQKALRAACAGLFDTLLVYRVDRFSRSLRDLTGLLDELADAQVVFRLRHRTVRHRHPDRPDAGPDARRVRRYLKLVCGVWL
jgi:site-specific DNA recombinase